MCEGYLPILIVNNTVEISSDGKDIRVHNG